MLDYWSRGPRPHHRLQENGMYIFCSLLNLLCCYPQVLHSLLWSRWYCKQIFVSLRTDALCCMGKQNRCLAKADFTKWVSLLHIWAKIDYFLNIKKLFKALSQSSGCFCINKTSNVMDWSYQPRVFNVFNFLAKWVAASWQLLSVGHVNLGYHIWFNMFQLIAILVQVSALQWAVLCCWWRDRLVGCLKWHRL